MSQRQSYELENAHVFKGTERKAFGVQFSSSEQWEISTAGSSFSDEVRGNWGREELVSFKYQARLRTLFNALIQSRGTFRSPFCPMFSTGCHKSELGMSPNLKKFSILVKVAKQCMCAFAKRKDSMKLGHWRNA